MIGNILKRCFGAVSGNDSTMTVDEDGDKIWKNTQGQWHRLDGPAYEGPSGTKEWYVNGKLHRLDGPAIERTNGTKSWWVDGKRHRLDGPAFEGVYGRKKWYIDDKELTEEAFNKHPDVLEFQRGRQAELEATEKAEAEAKKRKLDDMHKVLGAVVRDFHRKIGGQ